MGPKCPSSRGLISRLRSRRDGHSPETLIAHRICNKNYAHPVRMCWCYVFFAFCYDRLGETLDYGGSGWGRTRVTSGPCRRLVIYPGPVWEAQDRVESRRGRVKVPRGSRAGVCKIAAAAAAVVLRWVRRLYVDLDLLPWPRIYMINIALSLNTKPSPNPNPQQPGKFPGYFFWEIYRNNDVNEETHSAD